MNERVIKVKKKEKKKLEFWLQEQERGTYEYIVYIYTVANVVTVFFYRWFDARRCLQILNLFSYLL